MIAIRPGACVPPPPNTLALRTILDVTALSALESDVGEKHTCALATRSTFYLPHLSREGEAPPKAEGRSAGGGETKQTEGWGDKEEEGK